MTNRFFIFIVAQCIIAIVMYLVFSLQFINDSTKTQDMKWQEQQQPTQLEQLDWSLVEQLRNYSSEAIINKLLFAASKTPIEPFTFQSMLQCADRKLKQVDFDIKYWSYANPSVNEKMFTAGGSLILIYNQRIYKMNNWSTNPKVHVEVFFKLLTLLVKIVKLDNVILSVDFGDGILNIPQNARPTLLATKSIFSGEFLIPNFQIIRSLLSTKYPFAQHLPTKLPEASVYDFWKARKNTALFRGANSGPYYQELQHGTYPRFRLVEISKMYPELVDAGFSGYHMSFPKERKDEIMNYYGTVPMMSYSEAFSRYNYYVSVDGNTAAWRVAYLMSAPLVLIKQQSIFIEHFYTSMREWEDFVPVRNDLSDLVDAIKLKAQQIVNNQMKFVLKYLATEGTLCYMYDLLHQLSTVQKYFKFAKYANETLIFNQKLELFK